MDFNDTPEEAKFRAEARPAAFHLLVGLQEALGRLARELGVLLGALDRRGGRGQDEGGPAHPDDESHRRRGGITRLRRQGVVAD